eukprot:3112553-Rhodomonas_salina.10
MSATTPAMAQQHMLPESMDDHSQASASDSMSSSIDDAAPTHCSRQHSGTRFSSASASLPGIAFWTRGSIRNRAGHRHRYIRSRGYIPDKGI